MAGMEMRPEACVALMVVQMTTAVILKLFFFSSLSQSGSYSHDDWQRLNEGIWW